MHKIYHDDRWRDAVWMLQDRITLLSVDIKEVLGTLFETESLGIWIPMEIRLH